MNINKILILFSICFSLTNTKAQKNEISFGNAYFNNGNIFSGLEVNYFRNIGTSYALGLRSSLQFNNEEIRPSDKKHWSISVLGRIQTSSNKKLRTFIDSGFSFFKVRSENYQPTRPEQSFIPLKINKLSYAGFTLGLSIDYLIGKRFRLGINYRSYLLFPIQVEDNKDKRFESFPVSTLSYNF